jgi:hypothetical protein
MCVSDSDSGSGFNWNWKNETVYGFGFGVAVERHENLMNQTTHTKRSGVKLNGFFVCVLR